MPTGERSASPEYSQWPRLARATVAGLEAAICAVAAVAFVVSGLREGTVPTAWTLALVALAAAAGLAAVAHGFATGRRWPTGAFVTVQLLIAVIAVSQGARSWLTFTANPPVATVTLGALLLALAGLGVVALGERGRVDGDGQPRQ